ncbi:MAG: TadE/TadG family type IV pilus assembly protein [Xanthobacteraceae bacterium]
MSRTKSNAVRRLRRIVVGPLRRFARNRKGTSAIEFGFVVLPFIALLGAIIETGIIFLADQALETAVSDSARLVLTGQAQNGGMDQAAFKTAVCNNVHGLFDCTNGVDVDVRTFNNFASINFTPPINAQGNLVNNFVYQPGGPGQIVVVRLLYQFPVYMSLWNPSLINLAGNKRLLVATAAFRNEPYGP